jgi:hypothetical protein
MTPLPVLIVLACAAATQSADSASPRTKPYDAVMRAQYAAHGVALPQRPEEARRIYETYLNGIGQKTKSKSDNPSASGGEQPR